MSSTPNPDRLAEYESKLADLIATRDSFRAQHNGQRVRVLNRQIRSQLRWIKKARALQVTPARS